ncbi:MAG: hypothetical protein GWP35_10695, partial [Proteobacteria bacterium]|nr:hypothetical protein [Pseudomonadota bacterium]
MLDAQRFTGSSRQILLLIILATLLGGCDTGQRFGVQFGDPVITDPPPDDPEPVCDQPLVNSVGPVIGQAGSLITFTGVNFSDTPGGNRVVMSSFSGEVSIDALIINFNVTPEDPTDPTACGAVSTLTAMVPGGVRSGPVT